MTNQPTSIDLINFSGNSYGDAKSLKDYPIPNGYQKLDINLNDTETINGKEVKIYGNEGFQAAAYYNPTTNKLVISYAGSNEFKDLDDDSGFVTGATIDQAKYAQKFYDNALNNVNNNYPGANLTKDDITLTGHSLGGGLAAMIGILKDVVATVFNAPQVGRQIDNIEEMDNFKNADGSVNQGSITKGQLTSKDPSTFKVTNISLDSDGVHLAGSPVGKNIEVEDKGSIFGTVLYAIAGVAGAALITNPIGAVGGAVAGLLGKFVGSSILINHPLGVLKEAQQNQQSTAAGEQTTVQKFLNAVGSIDAYINKGTSSVIKLINDGINWMTSGHVTSDLTGAAKDAWSSTVSFFDGLFNGHDGGAPTNADGTVNNDLIDNSLLNLDIRTDKTQGFLSNQDTTQVGNVIGDGDWELSGPIKNINGDGAINTVPWGIASDQLNAARQTISESENFAKDIGLEFSNLDRMMMGTSSGQDLWNSTSLSANLSNLTNDSINARTFLNIDPVVLDLNGDGVKLTSYNDSEVTFDVDNDGKQERTGWVTPQDGILVDDQNHDGKINNITETISEYYNPNDGSTADADGKYSTDGLAALKKLDSNHDGKFNNQDAKWNDLRIWQDANGDAVTDAGELKTLNELGIKEFDLANIVQASKERNEGNIIFSKSTYTTVDNQTKQVAAVDFTTNPIGYEFNDVNLGKLATAEDGTKSLVIKNENGETVIAGSDTAQNIFGNIGNDTITGDDRDNWISGGAGSDTLKGGKGDDILIIDEQDKQQNIDGGEGRDIAIINSDKGVTFNLAQSNIETAVGGNGDDVLIGGGTSNVFIDGGSGDDIIIGGAADDALAGSDGNDYVDGGYGDDVVRGHRGNDVLIGGEGNDYLEGGLDDDKVFAGAGNDVIMEGAGNDEIDGGDGYDLVKYNGSYKDYKISRDGANYKVQDLTTGNIDSIKNIEGVRFNDVTIKLIDGNISPLPVADIIQIQNKTDVVFISVNDLLKNDLDVEGDALTLISVTNSVGGFAELVKDGNGNVLGVRWTPDKGFIGNMSFDYDIKDSKGAYTIIEQRNNDGSSVTAAMKARVTFKLASDPTDDLYTKQWYLSEINVQKAWADYTGEGIKIGVFEKGDFNINHEELKDNTLQSYKDDVAFRQIDQFSQHATTVAGVIAAERNGTGIVGVAYNSSLEGHSWNSDETGLANLKNVDIANNSWGAVGEFVDNFSDPNNADSAYAKLLEDSVKQGRGGLGTINVFAGGNGRADGDNVNYHNLQNSRFVIATGSINQPGDLATLTEASTPFSTPGDAILVSAPGSNINSTGNLLTNANGSTFLGEFASSQGTSFSAPIISGVVSLMLQANPNLGYRDVQKILALSARQFNDPNTIWQENGATNWNGGAMHFSHDYGFGEVDAAAAVRLAETWNEIRDAYNENHLTASDNSITQIVDNGVTTKQFTISNSNLHNIETVEVQVNLADLDISDLTIKLISPNGTESILMDKPGSSVYQGGLYFNFSSRAFLGENVDGNWQLQITDSKTGDVSYLNSWQLKFYGELDDGKNDTYIYTDEFAKMTDGSRGIIIDNDGGNDTINAAAVSSDSVINLNAGQISEIAGKDVLITGGVKGADYYQKQALLPTDQSQLATVNSQISEKNQALVADKSELTGIDAAINDKYQQANIKYAEYQVAVQNVSNDWLSHNTYWMTLIEGRVYDIYMDNVTHAQTALSQEDSNQRINNYNNLVGIEKQKASEYQSIVSEYNSLLARRDNLPSEISGLQNDVAILTKQATKLQSDINFINAYLNAFEDGKASIIENAYSGDGNDTIIGNDQDNKIWGGRGLNIETGGVGKDTFIIKQNSLTQDTITDFKIGEDKIDLSDFSNFDFAQLQILQNGSNTEITLISGQKIILQNLQANQISASDFIYVDKSKNIIDGTNANDVINGSVISDVINGGNGDDQINGNPGDDVLVGNKGNDILVGGDGNDVYVYNVGDGKDVIKEYLSAFNSSNDKISFGSGITKDVIYFTKSDNDLVIKFTNNIDDQITISDYFNKSAGGNGLEKLEFANGDFINISDPNSIVITYVGTSGDDTISVDSGNSIINSGDGDDLIYSGSGNDVINGGSGNDEVHTGSGNDTINGGDGDDEIHDGIGNDTIIGGRGDDSLALNMGDDTYIYNVGDGKDVIQNYNYIGIGVTADDNADNYGNDTISFGASITKDSIYFNKSSNDLIIKFVGNDQDQIILKNHWSLKTGVTTLKFQDGSTVDVSDISKLSFTYNGTGDNDTISVDSGNSIINSGDGNDLVYSGSGNDIINTGSGDDEVHAGSGNDTINGGEGNDQIHDGAGNDIINGGKGDDTLALNMGDDTYVYNLGDGKDLIQNYRYFGIGVTADDNADNYGSDTIQFGQSIDQESIYFAKSGNDLIIKFVGNSQDQITLKNHWSLKTGVTTLKFQDGSTVDVSDLSKLQFFDIVGDKNDNIINGTSYADAINGGAGNDTINGGDGDDTIAGGTGNDILSGDGGNDIIDGGEDNDNINGGSGNDQLFGGAGDDILVGGDGNNQLQGGDGNDVIDLGTGVESLFYLDQVNFAFGEGGSDRFVISDKSIFFKHKFDVIADFDVNDPNEKIDLSRIKGVDKYSDLKISQNGSDTYIVFNTNFLGYSQVIKLENVDSSKLDSSKFIITNEVPKVGNDSISTFEDNSIIINVLANDSDDKTDIAKTKITIVQPVNGSVTVNSDGTVTYKPKDNFNGVDQFEYQLTDAGGLTSSSAKVTVNINPVNDAPIVTKMVDDQTFYSTKGINFNVNNVFNDVDGDVLTYTATLADGSPLPNWISFNSETLTFSGMSPNGGGVFTIKLTATDGSNAGASTNIKLTINGNIIVGTDGDDNLSGNGVDNVIDGGLGNDVIVGGSGNEVIFGGAGNDQLSSGSGNDKLYGEAGDDILRGNSGNQILDGGDGNDKLYSAGSGSNDTLTGGSGSDIFVIGNDIISNDVITDFNVADPNEKIDLSLFKDVATDISQLVMEQVGADTKINFSSKSKTILIKNVSMDQLTAAKFIGLTDNKNSSGSLVINGTTGNDTLTGGTGNDIIKGDKGNDIIKGGLGSNLLTGGAGDDTFVISKNPGKTDIITDFEAFDSLSFDGFAAGTKLSNFSYTSEGNSVTFNLSDGQNLTFQNAKAADVLYYLSFTSISTSGTAGNDKIISSGTINGGDGNDLISGGSGDDTINGGKGNDILRGGDWYDIFEINKNPGDKDTILDFKMSDMVDSIVLKGFSDTKLSNYPAIQSGNDVVIDLGDDQTLTLKNFKLSDVPYIPSYSNRITNLTSSTVNDTDGNDIITTDSWYPGGATITTVSGKGNDVLTGASFAKDLFVINKNPGDVDFIRYVDTWRNDKVVLKGFSNDILDKIKFLPSSDPYTLIMDLGDGQILRTYGVQQSEFRSYFDVEKSINPTDGNDILSAGYFSTFIDGGAGNDVITGNNLGNTLNGGDGDDTITAGDGNDIINGGSGNDKITTGAGNDVVNAGSGNDEINISASGTKTISGGEGSDIYKISSFTGDITISDFDISNPNEVINLQNITNILSISNLTITQQGLDSVIQISASQKIILKNIDKNLLNEDKFAFYSNQFLGSPIADNNISGSVGDDFINTYGGNDSIYLSNSGKDTIDLGAGNDSITINGNGYVGNDNVTGGAGNDKFSIDLGYSYGDSNYALTINDFEVSNPNEKIYISNGFSTNMDFAKDLKIDQIGNDVQIKLNSGSSNKSVILKNVNKADLNENNIVLPREQYKAGTTESDDFITYDPNAGLKNLLGQDRGISVNGTMTNVSMVISGNYTTITLKAFDPSKDRIKVDPSYGIAKYSDMPLVQEGSNVAMNFVNETVPLSSGGSSFGATRYTKVVLENVNLADLNENDFIFYNHSTSGNDTISGLGGNDYIEGGLGDDSIYGGNGNDKLLGGDGNDNISGDTGDDEIYGGDGNDSLSDYSGSNKLYGGSGNDNLIASGYYGSPQLENELYGEDGNDIFQFQAGTNLAKGGNGEDEFLVYGGSNEIFGEDGVDNFIIGKSYSSTSSDGINYVITDKPSSTTIHDFDPSKETIMLDGFNKESLDNFDVIQDGNDIVFNLSSVQTLRLSNVAKSSLNQDNIIIPDKHIHDNYYYSFDDRTNEYSVNDLNKLMAENPNNFYQGPVAEIASDYDPVLMKMVSSFDVTKDKIHLGKIKTLEKFEDLKISQYSIAQSYGSPSEFTLIDLGNGTFVKLNGFYNLTADNFTFNKAPIANLSSVNIDEDSGIVLDVVSKAVDIDDDVLSIMGITNPSHGSATIITDEQGRQKISYIPTANFNGVDQFNYTISDGRGGVTTKTITVTVKSVNDNPIATITEANVNENNSVIIDVLAGTSDADGDQLSIADIYNVNNGVANVIDGKIVYTPNTNFSGVTKFDYTISDGNGGFITKTLNIDVKAVNNAPVTANDSFVTAEDRSIKILFSEILGNDSDIEDGLKLQNLGADNIIVNNPQNGIIIKNSDSITYIPNANYHGNDSISYQIKDSNGALSNEATINLNIASVNDAPIIASIIPNSTTNEDAVNTVLTAAVISDAFSDIDGDVLTYKASLSNGNPLPSWLSIDSVTGEITSTNPSNNDVGNYELMVIATDSSGAFVSQNFVLTVNNVNDAPTATLNSANLDEDSSTNIDVLASASDVDGDALTISSITNPAHGFAEIISDESGYQKIKYIPSFNFNGVDNFAYTISDGNGGTITKEINVTVNSINDAPVVEFAILDQTVDQGESKIILSSNQVKSAFKDVDGDSLTYSLRENSPTWLVIDSVTGELRSLNPKNSDVGEYNIAIVATDSSGASAQTDFVISVNNVNDAPIITATISDKINEDNSLTIDVLSKAEDIDVGDVLSIAEISQPENGYAKIVTDASGYQTIIYTPYSNYNGVDQVTYKISDGNGGIVTGVTNINVMSINDAPVATITSVITNEDKALNIDVLAGASDVDGDSLIISNITNPSHGIAEIITDANGYQTINYIPNKDYNGLDQFTYTISDGNGGEVTKVIDIDVKPINDNPIETIDSTATNEDSATLIDVLAASSDVDGDQLTINSVTDPNNGTVEIISDESGYQKIKYTPSPNFNGIDNFNYTISDGHGGTVTKEINVTVNSVNDAPTILFSILNSSVDQNEEKVIISSDMIAKTFDDVDGDVLTYSLKGGAPTWLSIDNSTGQVTSLNPSNDEVGNHQVTIIATDSSGASSVANFMITVNNVNDAPTANPISSQTNEDNILNIDVLRHANDIDGDNLIISEISKPSHGIAEIISNTNGYQTINYTPNSNYNGPDTISYKISDGNGGVVNQVVNINVVAVNDNPVASLIAFTTDEDNYKKIDVLAMASDVDGDHLIILSITNPSNGSASIVTDVNGYQTINYIPNSNYNGQDSFSYTISDGNGGEVTKTINVEVNPINDAPIANDLSRITNEDSSLSIDVLASVTDIDSDNLLISNITNTTNGISQIITDTNGYQTINYTPNKDFNGVDYISYTISDGNGGEVTKTIRIDVKPVNDSPIANLDSTTTNEDTSISIDVLAKASDVDGDNLIISALSDVINGVAEIVNNKIIFTPKENYNGVATLNYTISDGNGGEVTKSLNINLIPVNDDPVISNINSQTNEDSPLNIDVLAAASDVDSDKLIISNVTNPSNGSASIVTDANGYQTISYIPNSNYNGLDQFTYTVSDNNGGEVIKTINIDIKAVNDAPTIKSVIPNSSVSEDDVNTVLSVAAILNAFSDIDGDVLTYKALLSNGNPLPSWLSIDNITGKITSTNPSNDDVGNYKLIVTATDFSGASVSQNFTVTVNNVNDVPTASLVATSTLEDTTKIILSFNGRDIDVGDVLTYSILSNPSLGSVVNNNDGTFTFKLGNDFQNLALGQTKNVSFNYVAVDKVGAQSNVSTVTITITGINDAPTASITSIATNEDNSVKIDVLAGALDIDAGDILSLTSVTNGSHGNASIITDVNGNKVISYVPNANYNGSDVIAYTISDNNGGSITKELVVTVNAVNDVPVANLVSSQINEDNVLNVDVLSQASDIDGDNLIISKISNPSHGIAKIITDAKGYQTINYTPNHDFNGVDNLNYTISDGHGGNVTKTLSIKVNPVNDNPIIGQAITEINNNKIIIDVLANSKDIDGDALAIKSISGNVDGNLSIDNGKIIFTPNNNYKGKINFDYIITDGNGGEASGSYTGSYNLKAANSSAPVILSNIKAGTAEEGQGFSMTLDRNSFFDADGNNLSFEVKNKDGSTLPTWLTFNHDTLELKGTPPSGSYGVKELSVTVSDGLFNTTANFDLIIERGIEAKSGAKVISGSGNIATIGGGSADVVIGSSSDDVIQFNPDNQWSTTGVVAYNTYTHDMFSVYPKNHSLDAFDGKGGNDTLNLTSESDAIFLDDGISTNPSLFGARFAGIEVINGNGGNDIIDFSSDIYSYGNIEINGNTGNDVLWGNDGDDKISGFAGNDHIVGGRGNDTLDGGAGNDIIKGYDGDDIIIGGLGSDTLTGGNGNDSFVFTNLLDSTSNNSDIILDFVKGQDKIDLSEINSIHSINDLSFSFNGSYTIVNDLNSDFSFKISGHVALDNSDIQM